MAQVIRFNKPFDGPTHYFVRDTNGVQHLNFSEYQELGVSENFTVDSYLELVRSEDALNGVDLDYLLSIKTSIGEYDNTIHAARSFDLVWTSIEKKDEPTKTYAYKALMLFNVGEDTSSYQHDVLVWNSVHGIRRMTFGEYFDTISDGHTAAYRLAKLSLGRCNNLEAADFRFLKGAITNYNTKYLESTVFMAFRTCWFAATGEVMDL